MLNKCSFVSRSNIKTNSYNRPLHHQQSNSLCCVDPNFTTIHAEPVPLPYLAWDRLKLAHTILIYFVRGSITVQLTSSFKGLHSVALLT